jgi:hypothetical protein
VCQALKGIEIFTQILGFFQDLMSSSSIAANASRLASKKEGIWMKVLETYEAHAEALIDVLYKAKRCLICVSCHVICDLVPESNHSTVFL